MILLVQTAIKHIQVQVADTFAGNCVKRLQRLIKRRTFNYSNREIKPLRFLENMCWACVFCYNFHLLIYTCKRKNNLEPNIFKPLFCADISCFRLKTI